MSINLHTILPLTCLLLSISCGVFVLIRNHKEKLNQIFFFICLNISIWFSIYIPFNFHLTDSEYITWFKIAYCFISFIPIMIFTFVTTFLKTPNNQILYRINSTIGFSFCLLSLLTNTIVKGTIYYPWFPFPEAGNLHILLVMHCVSLASSSLFLIYKEIKNYNKSLKKINSLKYLFISIFSLTLGATDFIANYGIKIYPIGFMFATIFILVVTIAIIKHNLININLVIKKSLVYSLLVSTITLFYFCSIFLIERIFHSYIGYKTLTASLISATTITLLFIPLRNKIQSFIDKIFFHKTTAEIAEENILLKQEIIRSERMKTIATLASGLAQEIKNPLTPLKTFAEYLPHKINDKEFLLKFSSIISKEVNRIDLLVHELLDFAKPNSPELKLTRIHDLINSNLDFLTNDLIKNKIIIKKNYKLPFDQQILIDQNQIKQAMLNILLNAIDAIPNGGEIIIETFLTENTYSIIIKDTGIGINTKDLPHIFDPFFTKKDHGTGLGLSITHEIIRNHNGKIIAESIVNVGTTFRIELPV